MLASCRIINGIGTALVLLLMLLVACVALEGCGPKPATRSIFRIEQTLPYLTDSLALEMSRESLLRHYPEGTWEPMIYSETMAPDGSNDRYLQRNKSNPNRGTVHFIDKVGKVDQVVAVELSGTQISCELLRSK
jgi:hypothetical protein